MWLVFVVVGVVSVVVGVECSEVVVVEAVSVVEH